jgi:pyridoxal biosynthesis lyase PdxS
MLRTKGEAGTGNVVEAVRHARTVQREIRRLASMDEDELFVYAKEIRVRSSWLGVHALPPSWPLEVHS